VTDRKEYLNRDDWAVIANISDQEFRSDQAGAGIYFIPACPPGERASLTTIYGRTELYDLGDDRRGERYWAARVIAKSVLAEHNPEADLRRYGVFLCTGEAPRDDELREAAARRETFFREQVEQADALYARAPNRPELISDLQRRAARFLGLAPGWSKLRPTQECPACGEPVKVGVALCRHCGAVLDEEKAARFGVPIPRDRAGGAGRAFTPADADFAAAQPAAAGTQPKSHGL